VKRFALAVVVLSTACPSKQEEAKEQLADWMPADAEKLWQGAWVLRLEHDGPFVAVNITGGTAMQWDGTTEKPVRFAVTQPCAATFGGKELQFLIKNGAIVAGRGAAGMIRGGKGSRAVVCGDGRDPNAPEEGVYIVKGRFCQSWKRDAQMMWSSRDGVCAWANARGDDLIDVGTEHYYSSLVINGETAEEREFTRTAKENVRYATWDEAKQKIVPVVDEKSHLDAALQAGGVVGDTGTVAGFAATYAADKRKLISFEAEIPGTVKETTTNEAHGKIATTFVTIVDPSQQGVALVCEVTGEVKDLKAGDRVVVKGRPDMRHDYARLRPCTLAKR
jgi:hypothetical protein